MKAAALTLVQGIGERRGLTIYLGLRMFGSDNITDVAEGDRPCLAAGQDSGVVIAGTQLHQRFRKLFGQTVSLGP